MLSGAQGTSLLSSTCRRQWQPRITDCLKWNQKYSDQSEGTIRLCLRQTLGQHTPACNNGFVGRYRAREGCCVSGAGGKSHSQDMNKQSSNSKTQYAICQYHHWATDSKHHFKTSFWNLLQVVGSNHKITKPLERWQRKLKTINTAFIQNEPTKLPQNMKKCSSKKDNIQINNHNIKPWN